MNKDNTIAKDHTLIADALQEAFTPICESLSCRVLVFSLWHSASGTRRRRGEGFRESRRLPLQIAENFRPAPSAKTNRCERFDLQRFKPDTLPILNPARGASLEVKARLDILQAVSVSARSMRHYRHGQHACVTPPPNVANSTASICKRHNEPAADEIERHQGRPLPVNVDECLTVSDVADHRHMIASGS